MKTAVAADAQDPLETLRGLLWARMFQLMEPDPHWLKWPGYINLRMAVWDPERGWLATRPGISHGPLPLIDALTPEGLEEALAFYMKTGLRAILHRWNQP